MYKSEAVSQYLEEINSKKEEPKGKDEELIYLLKNIGNFGFSENREINSFISGIFIILLALVIISTFLAVSMNIFEMFFGKPLHVDRETLFLQNHYILMLFLSVGFWTFGNCIFLKGSIKNIKKALSLMMDKPYEIRIERVNYHSKKVKIIIEENLTSAGGVIKEKSKHITAYTNLSGNTYKDLVNFLFELAQKAEDSFSTSKKS